MSESNGRDVGRLEGRLDSHERRFDQFEKHQNERLDSIEKKVQEILDAANMGKGAWWLLLKIGAALATLAMAAHWTWDHLRAIIK